MSSKVDKLQNKKVVNIDVIKQAKEKEALKNKLKANDMLSPTMVAYLFPEIYKYRTLQEWRTIYDETKDSDHPIRLGPLWIRIGKRIIKYKVQWIWDDMNGLSWETIREQGKAIQ